MGKSRPRIRFQALLIETDDAYRAVIAACMVLADCRVHDVVTMTLGLAALERNRYDVIVWGVPSPAPDQRSGAIAEMRLRTEAPLVLVSGGFESAQQDLEAGADQWLPKPFVPGALVGALRAALRNAAAAPMPAATQHEVRGMHLNGPLRTLLFNGVETSFSRQEWDLLVILVEHPNRYLTTTEVLRLGFRGGVYGAEEVRIYMRRLRRKMEPLDLPCSLLSRQGQGYCLRFAS